jgi:hypothetical protein
MGNFDADGSIVGGPGMPGSFLYIEGLIDGSIDIEKEVAGKAADIMQYMKTTTRRPTGVIMEHNGVDHLG